MLIGTNFIIEHRVKIDVSSAIYTIRSMFSIKVQGEVIRYTTYAITWRVYIAKEVIIPPQSIGNALLQQIDLPTPLEPEKGQTPIAYLFSSSYPSILHTAVDYRTAKVIVVYNTSDRPLRLSEGQTIGRIIEQENEDKREDILQNYLLIYQEELVDEVIQDQQAFLA